MTMMANDLALALARQLRANADRAEKQQLSSASLSTLPIAECRVLADFIENATEAADVQLAEIERLRRRVRELLEANNRYLERARTAETGPDVEGAIRSAMNAAATICGAMAKSSPLHKADIRRLAQEIRNAAWASAIVAAGAQEGWQPTHRHIKRGSTYRVLGEARVQVAHDFRTLREDDRLTVYQGEDRQLWARFTDEFNDGRFEAIDCSGAEG